LDTVEEFCTKSFMGVEEDSVVVVIELSRDILDEELNLID